MINYLLRRIFYLIPILFGVNLITFGLFFMVNSPDDIARMHLGEKYVSQQVIEDWKEQRGYNKPLFYNAEKKGVATITDTLFFTQSIKLFEFNFGQSNQGRDISTDISQRMWPSLALAIPTLLFGLAINITFALLIALFRGKFLDRFFVVACVIMMSISGLFYIIGGQFFFGKLLKWVPLSGYEAGWSSTKFLILPIVIGIITGIGSGTRWYRTLFLEEINKDYVRTARAKGLSEWAVLVNHVFRNSLIPILTGVVVIIPTLFLGSLIMESFFGIPGLGSYTIEAIQRQDFDIVRVMVFLGTLFYIVGLILTDLSYVLADPRIRLN